MSKSARDIFGMVSAPSVTEEGLEIFASILDTPTRLERFLCEGFLNDSIIYNSVEPAASFLGALFNTEGEQARELFVKAMINLKVIDKLMLGGKRRWLESRLDKLSNDQVVEILRVPNNVEKIGLEYSNPMGSWLIKKIEELDNDQITEILSTKGAIEGLSREKAIPWLIKILDNLDQDQVTKVLSTEIFNSSRVYDGLVRAAFGDWLKEKQEAMRASKAGSVAPAIQGPQ